jgi:hypothetical protein
MPSAERASSDVFGGGEMILFARERFLFAREVVA